MAPQSARYEERECCGHNHEIEPRAVQAEIHDGDEEQRKHENPRYSCDRCYQLKSPVEARLRVSTFTDVWHRGRERGSGGTFQVEPHRITEVMGKP